MITPLRRLGRDTRGAGAVEFALVLPALVFMLFGGVEIGRMAWTQHALQQTAMAGARCMGLLAAGCASAGAYDATSTASYVVSTARGLGVGLAPANLLLNRTATCAGVANFSAVTISYTFNGVFPGLLLLAGGTKSLSASACFPNNA